MLLYSILPGRGVGTLSNGFISWRSSYNPISSSSISSGPTLGSLRARFPFLVPAIPPAWPALLSIAFGGRLRGGGWHSIRVGVDVRLGREQLGAVRRSRRRLTRTYRALGQGGPSALVFPFGVPIARGSLGLMPCRCALLSKEGLGELHRRMQGDRRFARPIPNHPSGSMAPATPFPFAVLAGMLPVLLRYPSAILPPPDRHGSRKGPTHVADPSAHAIRYSSFLSSTIPRVTHWTVSGSSITSGGSIGGSPTR